MNVFRLPIVRSSWADTPKSTTRKYYITYIRTVKDEDKYVKSEMVT